MMRVLRSLSQRRLSPRLGAILNKYGASLREGAFEPGMVISIMDIGFDVDDSAFTARGKSVLRDAERASMDAMSRVRGRPRY